MNPYTGARSVGATQREAGERFATIVAQNARGYPFRLSRAPRTKSTKQYLENA